MKGNTYLMHPQEPGVTVETKSLQVSGLQTPATRFQFPPLEAIHREYPNHKNLTFLTGRQNGSHDTQR